MRTGRQNVVDSADTFAVREKCWLELLTEGEGNMLQEDGGGPVVQRRVRAVIGVPSRVEVTNKDAGAVWA